MRDLIDRNVFYKELNKSSVRNNFQEDDFDCIQHLLFIQPSVSEPMKWISVEDAMPPKDETKKYLVVVAGDKAYDGKPFVTYRFCCNGKFEPFQWSPDRHITHWMPWPEPPKGENE